MADFIIEQGILKEYTGAGGHVVVPDGVTVIGTGAFARCRALTGITLPAGLIWVREGAFYGCTGLVEVTLPEGLTTIGKEAFMECANLWRVGLPRSLAELRDRAFMNCSGLQYIELPEGLRWVRRSAFENCRNLQKAVLSKTVARVDDRVFYGCRRLRTIVNYGMVSIAASRSLEPTAWGDLPMLCGWLPGEEPQKRKLAQQVFLTGVYLLSDEAYPPADTDFYEGFITDHPDLLLNAFGRQGAVEHLRALLDRGIVSPALASDSIEVSDSPAVRAMLMEYGSRGDEVSPGMQALEDLLGDWE